MGVDVRFFPGDSLPRSHQAIILLTGLALAGLWVWQTGLFRPVSPPNTPQRHYYIEMGGQLSSPGRYCFLWRPTLQEAWEKAGGRGLLPGGDRFLTSGSSVRVGEDGGVRLERMAGAELLTLGLAIDLNQADAKDLEAIPGIGPVLAGRIMAWRQSRGPFRDITELLAVKGIGPGTLQKIRPYVAVSEIKVDS